MHGVGGVRGGVVVGGSIASVMDLARSSDVVAQSLHAAGQHAPVVAMDPGRGEVCGEFR